MNIRAVVTSFLICLSFAGVAESIKVTVYADESYPPYSYKENGDIKGIYTLIAKTVFSRMKGYKVKIVAVPWKRGLKYLEDGTGFALYPPYFHVAKRPYIWPYSMPILDERVILFCTEDVFYQSVRSRWVEDYYGLTIGINAGFHLGGEKFWQAVKQGKVKVSEARGNTENLLRLGLKRIDCYLNDRISILGS